MSVYNHLEILSNMKKAGPLFVCNCLQAFLEIRLSINVGRQWFSGRFINDHDYIILRWLGCD